MISADDFLSPAKARGFDFYTGVPCSFLTPVINAVISDRSLHYVGAASEGEAVAIAAGAWVAGRKTVVMCQNSGLGNAVNPLTSLNEPFRIPTLFVTTWRGQPGIKDEPQHQFMGEITPHLLDTLRLPHLPFPKKKEDVGAALAAAESSMAQRSLPFAFIMEEGTVRDDGLNQEPLPPRGNGALADRSTKAARVPRIEVLKRFLEAIPPQVGVITTTGKCTRELFTLDDRKQHLYQVGSMGGASAMALGLALNTERPIAVLDGDGAALMKLGNFATIGTYAPKNLIHIVLDNGVHDSTGGQATVSANVDFARIALACGYPQAALCDDLAGFTAALENALKTPGPHLIHMRMAPGSIKALGRPTVSPDQVVRRFQDFLKNG